jgi:hypothetical protein
LLVVSWATDSKNKLTQIVNFLVFLQIWDAPSWVLVISQNNTVLFKSGEVAKTQIVLPGFSVAVDELMA